MRCLRVLGVLFSFVFISEKAKLGRSANESVVFALQGVLLVGISLAERHTNADQKNTNSANAFFNLPVATVIRGQGRVQWPSQEKDFPHQAREKRLRRGLPEKFLDVWLRGVMASFNLKTKPDPKGVIGNISDAHIECKDGWFPEHKCFLYTGCNPENDCVKSCDPFTGLPTCDSVCYSDENRGKLGDCFYLPTATTAHPTSVAPSASQDGSVRTAIIVVCVLLVIILLGIGAMAVMLKCKLDRHQPISFPRHTQLEKADSQYAAHIEATGEWMRTAAVLQRSTRSLKVSNNGR